MKNITGCLLLALLALFSCTQRETYELKISNPLDVARQDELVVISRVSLETKTGEIPAGKEINIYDGEQLVPVQLDDMDGDGEWDELALLVDLQPNETKAFQYVVEDSLQKEPVAPRTNIRFGKIITKGEKYEELTEGKRIQGTATEVTSEHFQMEGPGWENDKVGFRNYFDERNGIDIFGKTTSEMVLDKVGINENYHEMQDWGMDILKVGTSLGAGALALQYNDSLIRVTAPDNAHYQLITEGPFRSVFKFTFEEIAIGEGATVGVEHKISIEAGDYGYNSAVTITGRPEEMQLVTGLVNLQSDTAYFETANDAAILYTHANQSYKDEPLGLAIVTSADNFDAQFTAPEEGDGITSTYCMIMAPKDEVDFSFFAGWEKSDAKFAQKDAFFDYINQQALLMNSPVEVSY